MIRIIRIFVYLFISFWIRIFELNWIHLMMFLKRQIMQRKSSRERLNNKTRYHWRGLFIRWLIKLNTFELLPNSYLSMTPTFTECTCSRNLKWCHLFVLHSLTFRWALVTSRCITASRCDSLVVIDSNAIYFPPTIGNYTRFDFVDRFK